MIRSSFNDGWSFRRKTDAFLEILGRADAPWQDVRLPHDAMVGLERDRADTEAGQRGYYPSGEYQYRKTFFAPEEYRNRRVTLEFEGVYRNARVFINGDFAAQRAYGYSNFYVHTDHLLKYGSNNEIVVEARSGNDTRWYSGGGVYRNTKLIVGDLVHLALDGVRITTPAVDDDGTVVAGDTAPVTTFIGDTLTLRQRLPVPRPELWGVERPYLYLCRTSVTADGELLDQETTRFGIRTLTVDPLRGLRINGETVNLRGACIHHDNGVIGAATIDRAEQRRVEILKQAGFNAIRSAHHPMSKALLDTCDQLGVLVIDELFDAWTRSKVSQDYALDFATWWESDVRAMVDKDFNHPSVILYSIGNEIPETGTAAGAAISRRLAETIRSIDSTRFVTNGVNGLLAGGPDLLASFAGESRKKDSESLDVNGFMTRFREFMPILMSSEVVGSKTAESIACLDVAGYNYLESRYGQDGAQFPNRVIVGTETYPTDIDTNWRLEIGFVYPDLEVVKQYVDIDHGDYQATFQPAILAGAAALGLVVDFTEPANAACIATLEAALPALTGKLVDPATVPSGQPTPGTSESAACRYLTLFQAIAEKAGKDLTYQSFQQAAFSLGSFQVPTLRDKATYSRETPHGAVPPRLFTFDPAKKNFFPAGS
ncbi:glycoside hydrolase family 2 sugar binding [Parafrankia sp. EAN1pec]|uniref:glycoside hydrolase family 2 protein n=1 Tax=Parafrankia sp. (strain EAN1pec) TaxID=298653 RepID=UPI0000542778|nr:glycoside hydrolase family 2 sugar binding [Frankia sp. EAN1pec]